MENEIKYRICRTCGRILPIGGFTPNKDCKGGYEPRCRRCKNHRITSAQPVTDVSLSDLPYEAMIEELRRRGFRGELHATQKVTI